MASLLVTKSSAITYSTKPVWYEWCSNTMTSAATDTNIWPQWCMCNSTVSSITTASATVWTGWNTTHAAKVLFRPKPYVAPPVPTPEELAAQRRRHRTVGIMNQERRAAANRRADALLRQHLTEEQRAQYDSNRRFRVVSESGKRFEIDATKYAGNILVLGKDDQPEARICCHAREAVPLADHILTQMLFLLYAEALFMREANVSSIVRRA